MKIVTHITLAFFCLTLFSCHKEETAEPVSEQHQAGDGVIQKMLSDSSSVFVLDRKDDYDYNLPPTVTVDVGFFFRPTKDITIVSAGCKTQELGDHQIIIRKFGALRVISDTLLIDTIKVLNDTSFFYKDLSKQIILSKDFEYAIYYSNKSLTSIWNANYSRSGFPVYSPRIFPMYRDDVIIKENISIYYNSGRLFRYSFIENNGLRGLPDFKYK